MYESSITLSWYLITLRSNAIELLQVNLYSILSKLFNYEWIRGCFIEKSMPNSSERNVSKN